MANESLAVAAPRQGRASAADHYEAFHEVLAASERGRTFLTEHVRRSRAAETEVLLAALARIEALVRSNAAPQTDAVRDDLRTLVANIRSARPSIEQSALPTRAAKLGVLLDLLEQRLAALAGPATAETAAPAARAHLAVVPSPHEPELPIPSPAAQPPAITIAPPISVPEPQAEKNAAPPPDKQTAAFAPDGEQGDRIALAITDMMGTPRSAVTYSEPVHSAPAVATMPEAAAKTAMPPAQPDAKFTPPPPDPLAPLMLLSEEERIALFT
jgi:hypothetical protein